jgi:hypothetical protein
MKTSVLERYVVAIEHEGKLEGGYWCETLKEAQEYASDVRSELEDPNEKHEVLILKVLRI